MAKIKLPEALKSWKVVSAASDTDEREIYKLVSKDGDGAQKEAQLAYYEFTGSLYNQDDIEYIKDEADFVKTIKGLGDISNYVDVVIDDNPEKQKMEVFIVTDNSKPLSEVMKDKSFSEDEVIDFGLQMSEILEKIENAGIFHGDIKPSDIFVTEDGKYKLGAFMDAESLDENDAFLAPEMHKGENADFTTDLYSLGMIMYTMCNDGKLPFEGEGVSADEAVDKRLAGESVPAPKNGSPKLKSVVMIAIQSENKNRWKNAGNIKNALLSLKNEEADKEEKEEPSAQIIAPASTEFDGNVFEDESLAESARRAQRRRIPPRQPMHPILPKRLTLPRRRTRISSPPMRSLKSTTESLTTTKIKPKYSASTVPPPKRTTAIISMTALI